jgi:hypothetical protein
MTTADTWESIGRELAEYTPWSELWPGARQCPHCGSIWGRLKEWHSSSCIIARARRLAAEPEQPQIYQAVVVSRRTAPPLIIDDGSESEGLPEAPWPLIGSTAAEGS